MPTIRVALAKSKKTGSQIMAKSTSTIKSPGTINVKLEPCCKRALEQIRDKQQLGSLLQKMLGVSPLLLILGGNPPEGAVTIFGTDWGLLAKAVKGVPVIVKNRCQQIAGFERLKHPGGQLNRFWTAMYNSFN